MSVALVSFGRQARSEQKLSRWERPHGRTINAEPAEPAETPIGSTALAGGAGQLAWSAAATCTSGVGDEAIHAR